LHRRGGPGPPVHPKCKARSTRPVECRSPLWQWWPATSSVQCHSILLLDRVPVLHGHSSTPRGRLPVLHGTLCVAPYAGTLLQRNGNLFGGGIYFSSDYRTAYGFSRPGPAWPASRWGLSSLISTANTACLAPPCALRHCLGFMGSSPWWPAPVLHISLSYCTQRAHISQTSRTNRTHPQCCWCAEGSLFVLSLAQAGGPVSDHQALCRATECAPLVLNPNDRA
jgi:hypothetical protein